MYFIPALLFALSANIDSFILGLSLGIRKTRLSILQNLFVSAITLSGTMAALQLGRQAFHIFPLFVTRPLGSLLLIIFGGYYIFRAVKQSVCRDTSKTVLSTDKTPLPIQSLSYKEGLFTGLTLSVNNFAIGISAGISGLSFLPAALCSLIFSFLFLFLGNLLGLNWITRPDTKSADLISGIILILLGIYECIF